MFLGNRTDVQNTDHGGSVTKIASVISPPGTSLCLHGRTRAQILKAEAVGPSVPAIMGNADEANHQRLWERLVQGSTRVVRGD